MGLSRRKLLSAAAGGGTAAALAGLGMARIATASPTPASSNTASAKAASASAPGDVVGKVTVGYQGWFACKGDGAPINAWWHWARDASQPPSPSNTGIKSWP